MKEKLVSLLVLCMLTASLVPIVGLSGGAGDAPEEAPSEMLIWEAYAKGYITITQLMDATFRVVNSADVPVKVDENVQLLSPSPLDISPQVTTQDGTLMPATIPAQSNQIFTYGDPLGGPLPPEPNWWCTEANQLTQAAVRVTLGGEVIPYAMQSLLLLPKAQRQNAIWDHQDFNPTVVIGKTPLWAELPDNQENVVEIQLAITNTGFAGASSALVIDRLLPGYSYDPASFSVQPDSITQDVIGNIIITWHVSLDPAIVTDPQLLDPTEYDTEFITYDIITPILDEGRHFLPRAFVDHDDDVNNDAHSAKPLLEVYHVNDPPVPDAGGVGGFYYLQEGNTVTLDAGASFDPEGSPLEFRWDLDLDGVWDTPWSSDPTVDMTLGDDTSGMVKLEVTDGEDNSVAFAYYVFENVAPTLDSFDFVVSASQPRTIGYWGRQCWDWLPPSPDHLGILPQYVQFIASGSQVFSSVQSKADVCAYLEEVDHSVMLEKAKQQLIANWLNVASGNLSLGTQVDLPELNYTGTVGEFLEMAENAILNNDEAELERVKTIADYINNGVGVEIATVTFTASATDPGSDDISFMWDFGDGTTYGPEWKYNDGSGPDPDGSTGGTYPFTAGTIASTSYMGLGTYTVQLTLVDDDDGELTQTFDVLVS
jgi:hypothetical protein